MTGSDGSRGMRSACPRGLTPLVAPTTRCRGMLRGGAFPFDGRFALRSVTPTTPVTSNSSRGKLTVLTAVTLGGKPRGTRPVLPIDPCSGRTRRQKAHALRSCQRPGIPPCRERRGIALGQPITACAIWRVTVATIAPTHVSATKCGNAFTRCPRSEIRIINDDNSAFITSTASMSSSIIQSR